MITHRGYTRDEALSWLREYRPDAISYGISARELKVPGAEPYLFWHMAAVMDHYNVDVRMYALPRRKEAV